MLSQGDLLREDDFVLADSPLNIVTRNCGISINHELALFVFPAVLLGGLLGFLDVLLPAVNNEGVRQQELGLLEQGGAVLVEDEERSLLAGFVVAFRDFLWNELILEVKDEVEVGQFRVVAHNAFQISLVSDCSLVIFHLAIGVDLAVHYGEPDRLYFAVAASFLDEFGELEGLDIFGEVGKLADGLLKGYEGGYVFPVLQQLARDRNG